MKDDNLSDVGNLHYCSKCDSLLDSDSYRVHDCSIFPFKSSVGISNVYEKEIWNAAIEAAANNSIKSIGYETKSSLGIHVACEIRKLKK
jgi:hypothetical protein